MRHHFPPNGLINWGCALSVWQPPSLSPLREGAFSQCQCWHDLDGQRRQSLRCQKRFWQHKATAVTRPSRPSRPSFFLCDSPHFWHFFPVEEKLRKEVTRPSPAIAACSGLRLQRRPGHRRAVDSAGSRSLGHRTRRPLHGGARAAVVSGVHCTQQLLGLVA